MGDIKVNISKETLEHLYWKENLSTDEIAKKYGYTHSGILYKMGSFGIKRRSKLGLRKPVIISKRTLKNLYESKKMSETKIANILGCSRHAIEIRMNLYEIKPRGYRESNTKYPKKNFSGNLSEKAYLIGFRLGDLNISKRHYLILARCSSTIPAQIELIKNLFSPYTFVYTKPSRVLNGKQVVDIQCLLNESFDFLLPKQDRIENWILKNNKYFFAFTAGYIDAEGHIYTRIQHKTPFSGLQIQTYDKNMLNQIWQKLNELGIECPKPLKSKYAGYIKKDGTKYNKDLWRLEIAKKHALSLLFEKIADYIKHEKRKNDLDKAWSNVKSRL